MVSNNREVGAELNRGPVEASASYFWSSSKFGQLLVLNNGVFDVQRQRVEIEGLELNVKSRTPVPGLDVSAGYARLRGKTDSNGDGKVDLDLDGANISPDRLNLAADFRRGKFSTRLQVNAYLKRDFHGTDTRNNFSGYTLADAFARYELPVGALSLGIQNLLDKQYISYSSDTTNPADNLRFFAGRGRSYTLGWDYRF